MSQTVFALVDCNNFFVSCERVFRPDLEGRPVVVLSSNDGCAVARSNEVKALGVPMGAPAFKYRELFDKYQVVKFSANFELYGDISKRIIHILTEITPRTEIYSIDEAFLELSQLATADFMSVGRKLRNRVWQEVGIPVSVGLATSKTLAKVAADYAKKHPDQAGVTNLIKRNTKYQKILAGTPIEDVWGVGWRLAPMLRGQGLATAWDLANLPTQRARQLMGVKGEQMVRELQGQTCFGFKAIDTKPKTISRTRTFGADTDKFHVLEAAISDFVTQASYRLRLSNQLCWQAGVFMMTNRHKPGFKSTSRSLRFDMPTADPGQISQALVNLASTMFQTGLPYHRAGIWLADFARADQLQTDLLGNINIIDHDRAQRRLQSVDQLNKRYGRGTVKYAAAKLAASWQPKHMIRSPRYTTRWDELPLARFKTT